MPAYNEQDVLPEALAEAVTALDRVADEWELVVVDDGSTDRTPQILAEWSAREPRVRVLTQRPNQGYSKALARGFAAARFEAVFYTDADAQFDLAEITRLAPHLAIHDKVAGYRLDRKDPWVRLLTSRVYNLIQGLTLGIRVRDVNCAFKLFRRSFFERVTLSSDGFLVDAELYARARRAGLTWTQVGVTHRPRLAGSSTVKAATVTATLRELWRLRRSLRT
jgi:glycosyltransferase involved in cell wall biosynthesis